MLVTTLNNGMESSVDYWLDRAGFLDLAVERIDLEHGTGW